MKKNKKSLVGMARIHYPADYPAEYPVAAGYPVSGGKIGRIADIITAYHQVKGSTSKYF